MAKNIGKNIIKNLSGKYSQPRDHATQYTTDVLKTTSKRVIQKTVETKESNSETVTNDNDKEIH